MLQLVVFATLVAVCQNYPTGAPDVACDSMVPLHGVDPQTSSSPYSIAVSKSTYGANETINVTLSGTGGLIFRGFLVEPRVSSGVYQTVGQLTPIDTDMINNCGKSASLTHTNNSNKTSVNMMWTAPPSDSGPVIFQFSVVQVETMFWVKQKSVEISFQG